MTISELQAYRMRLLHERHYPEAMVVKNAIALIQNGRTYEADILLRNLGVSAGLVVKSSFPRKVEVNRAGARECHNLTSRFPTHLMAV